MQHHDKGVFCVSWKGIRLESYLPVREVGAFGNISGGCALKFAVCIMTVSKGVANVYVG